MDIDKLINTGANIKVEISPEDLRCFGETIAERSFEAFKNQTKEKQETRFISVEKVLEILDISRTTLWQWDKKGITKQIRFGNLKRYMRSDIETIGQNSI